MNELNANLVAVQWGVLSVFGVVVGLLLPSTAAIFESSWTLAQMRLNDAPLAGRELLRRLP
jgi:predicted Co/Zn/Cd cation transporter (cation efflux family)